MKPAGSPGEPGKARRTPSTYEAQVVSGPPWSPAENPAQVGLRGTPATGSHRSRPSCVDTWPPHRPRRPAPLKDHCCPRHFLSTGGPAVGDAGVGRRPGPRACLQGACSPSTSYPVARANGSAFKTTSVSPATSTCGKPPPAWGLCGRMLRGSRAPRMRGHPHGLTGVLCWGREGRAPGWFSEAGGGDGWA